MTASEAQGLLKKDKTLCRAIFMRVNIRMHAIFISYAASFTGRINRAKEYRLFFTTHN